MWHIESYIWKKDLHWPKELVERFRVLCFCPPRNMFFCCRILSWCSPLRDGKGYAKWHLQVRQLFLVQSGNDSKPGEFHIQWKTLFAQARTRVAWAWNTCNGHMVDSPNVSLCLGPVLNQDWELWRLLPLKEENHGNCNILGKLSPYTETSMSCSKARSNNRRGHAGSSTWVTTAPCNATGLGRSGWKAAWQKRTWECWLTAGWTWASSVPRWPRGPTASWLVSGIVWPAGVGRWLSPCAWHGWGRTSSTVFSFGSPSTRKLRCWSMFKEGQQSWWRV